MKQNKYLSLGETQLEEHLSNYAMQKFSHSSLGRFSRNPLDFMKHYIFSQPDERRSDGMIIGSAFHHALEEYFSNREYDWEEMELGKVCDEYIDALEDNIFKFTKKWKDKSVADIKEHCKKQAKIHVANFWDNKKWFDDNILLVISTEFRIYDFVRFDTIDYDIPLPVVCYIDIVFVHVDMYIACTDYKTGKQTTRDEAEVDNIQQITINNCALNSSFVNRFDKPMWDSVLKKFPKLKLELNKFFIIQFKASKNRDGSPQVLVHEIPLKKKIPFFEAFIFSQLQSFFSALRNTEHVYQMNMTDNYSDSVMLLNFWIEQYQGSQVFKMADSEQIQKNVMTISKALIDKLKNNSQFINSINMSKASAEEKIIYKLSVLGCPAEVEHVINSYSCITYLVEPKSTTTVKKIQAKHQDIAQALGVSAVRISNNLVEKDGKSFISIQCNKTRTGLETPIYTPKVEGLKVPFGESIFKDVIQWDLNNPSTPHVMISGATGSGKSICVESMIDILKSKDVKITVLDPKREFTGVSGIDVLDKQEACEDFIEEMVKRVDEIFELHGANGNINNKHVIIIDEVADLIMKQTTQRKIEVDDTSSQKAVLSNRKKEVVDRKFKTLEDNIVILSQKARSAGVHLVLAAQRFSVDVLKGTAKANFSTRLCFYVNSKVDSMVMIDEEGAQKLNGKGDCLYVSPEENEPIRMQAYMKK